MRAEKWGNFVFLLERHCFSRGVWQQRPHKRQGNTGDTKWQRNTICQNLRTPTQHLGVGRHTSPPRETACTSSQLNATTSYLFFHLFICLLPFLHPAMYLWIDCSVRRHHKHRIKKAIGKGTGTKWVLPDRKGSFILTHMIKSGT